MKETLLYGEMSDRFDGEWVVVADPELDDSGHVVSGRVIAHGADRDAVYRQVTRLQIKPKRMATLCFKVLEEDQAVVL